MPDHPDHTFQATRHIAAPPDQVFAALTDPARLARWWGPNGFTNEVSLCDMRPGGRWVFVMHGPDGRAYPNENVFETLTPPQADQPAQFVVRHVGAPLFRMHLTLHADGAGTRVEWAQVFDSAEVAAQLAALVVPANAQNLSRLSAEVLGAAPP